MATPRNPKDKDKDKDAAADKEPMPPSPPKRDLKLETLAEVLKGNIRVHMHCYRSDEMATMLDVADEFGFKITAFHHAVEAYKIADRLAEKNVCAAMWADWWGFKMEAYDGIQENLAIVDLSRTQLRHRALGFRRWHSAVEPGSRQGDGPRRARGIDRPSGTRHPLANPQSGEVAGPRGSHRHAGGRQGSRCRHLERQSLQRLRARGASVHRRRAQPSIARIQPPPQDPISSWAGTLRSRHYEVSSSCCFGGERNRRAVRDGSGIYHPRRDGPHRVCKGHAQEHRCLGSRRSHRRNRRRRRRRRTQPSSMPKARNSRPACSAA